MSSRLSPGTQISLLVALAALLVGASVVMGELSIANSDLSTLWGLHGPRALLALGVGAILAVAGVLLQALFANPLCEPYTLGISSGATLGAVLVGALGLTGWISEVVHGIALGPLAGALVFALPLGWAGGSLLLMGVMLGFFGSSLVALVLALSPKQGVSHAMVWLLGDLSRATLPGAVGTLAVGALLTLWILRRHAELDALLLGEGAARSIGVPVDSLRREIVWVTSVLVAWGVALTGMIGFVGLMIPHAVRSWQGASHRRVLPVAFVCGGIAVVLADLMGRLMFSPREVPVGVLTALLGAPAYALRAFWSARRA